MNKRLSNRWQTRVAFSFNDWREYSRRSGRVPEPDAHRLTTDEAGRHAVGLVQVDGGQIAPRSGGSGKGDMFYNASWQLNANGFYQLPGGFDLGANIFGRQGYVQPLYVFQVSAGGDGSDPRARHADARRGALSRSLGRRPASREDDHDARA